MILAAVAVSQALGAARPGRAVERPDFYPASLQPAARWLADCTGPDDVVLAHPKTGIYLARVMSGRVYIGH